VAEARTFALLPPVKRGSPRTYQQPRMKFEMISEVHVFAARAATFLTLATVGLVASPDRAAAQATDAAAGQKVYAQVCLGCHTEAGTGNPGVYPPLDGSEWVNTSPERLVNILLHGLTGPVTVAGEEYTGLMPGWGQSLKDEEIAAVATYIRGAWGNFSSAVSQAQVTAIREATKSRTTPWTAPELVAATPAK
jgi:mono/diheme cytochrome c family protein